MSPANYYKICVSIAEHTAFHKLIRYKESTIIYLIIVRKIMSFLEQFDVTFNNFQTLMCKLNEFVTASVDEIINYQKSENPLMAHKVYNMKRNADKKMLVLVLAGFISEVTHNNLQRVFL